MGRSAHPALVHSHGVWHPANHWAAQAARAWGVPLIIHPRGMLEPWALGQKPLKKRLALALFQRRDLESARAFVATSEMECEGLRRFGLKQPVAVIPNGVDFDDAAASDLGGARRQDGERIALFLSRVHPKKGVLELVQAWGQVAPAGWRLRIAGPDEGGHWGQVERLVRQLGLGARVEYLGPVEGARKAALYREADLFVLPTFSENFGVVVAEALAHGLPVITTRGAPWADLETYGCGWWIEVGVEPLVVALREAMALTRRAAGRDGGAGAGVCEAVRLGADCGADGGALPLGSGAGRDAGCGAVGLRIEGFGRIGRGAERPSHRALTFPGPCARRAPRGDWTWQLATTVAGRMQQWSWPV